MPLRHLDLWNLNKNMESPVLRCEPNTRRLALNKCSWAHDGRKLATGDSEAGKRRVDCDVCLETPDEKHAGQHQRLCRGPVGVATQAGVATHGLSIVIFRWFLYVLVVLGLLNKGETCNATPILGARTSSPSRTGSDS